MSFWRGLFGGKDARYHIERGDRLLADGRYADARVAYGEALERLGANDDHLRDEIGIRRSEAGDSLARINIEEAERCLNAGDSAKAQDHLELARELASLPDIREHVARLAQRLGVPQAMPRDDAGTGHVPVTGGCACPGDTSGPSEAAPPAPPASDGHLTPEERFELMTAALPEDLPSRYRALGTRFAEGYLRAHDGDDEAACGILSSLSIPGAQDIINYELALIRHRQERVKECESLLRSALRANDRNPLCYSALVDLCAGTGRAEEALSLADTMIALELMPEQALMIKGDLLHAIEEDEQALASYGALLATPYKKEAALRAIPILEKLGRGNEAQQVFKQYVKGCC